MLVRIQAYDAVLMLVAGLAHAPADHLRDLSDEHQDVGRSVVYFLRIFTQLDICAHVAG